MCVLYSRDCVTQLIHFTVYCYVTELMLFVILLFVVIYRVAHKNVLNAGAEL